MIRPKLIYSLGRKAITAYLDDYAMSMGAAISYYSMFSLAPLLVLVIAVAGAVFGREAVQGLVVEQLGGLVGTEGATFVQGLVASASDTDRGLIAGMISVVMLLIGATTVFAELQSALDRIWHVPEREKPSGIWAVLRARVLSFGLILGLAFLLMVSLAVSTAVAALGSWSSNLLPGGEVLMQVAHALLSVGITTLLFAMIFKLMPSTPVAWQDVWIGAVVTAILFEVGKLLIGLYLGKSGLTETFAAAASLAILLVWMYYAAQIFLLGAEFTKIYADEHGSLAGARAIEGSRATKDTGLPTGAPPSEGLGSAWANGREVSSYPESIEYPLRPGALAKKVEKEKSELFKELMSLVVISIASVMVSQWRKRVQKRLSPGSSRRLATRTPMRHMQRRHSRNSLP
jgi:membrane protein